MEKIKTKIETTTTKSERNIIDLASGKKKATTDSDQRLLKQLQSIKTKGKTLYIPHD